MSAPVTPSTLSMREQWDRAADGWSAHGPQIGAWLARATDDMLGLAGVGAGSRVLDVAAGAGDQTLTIAQRVGSTGSVPATDLSPAILALARDNALRADLDNVQVQVGDGQDLGVEDGSFDAVVCRLGLMFFPDPRRGLREMHRALRAGGGICAMVFSQPQCNPCLTILVSTALEHAGRAPRDPFEPGGLLSLGRPGLISELFEAAGFDEVATTRIDAPFRLPSVKDYLHFVRNSASPIQHILRGLGESAADAAWADIEAQLSIFNKPDGWEGPNELLLTARRKPAGLKTTSAR